MARAGAGDVPVLVFTRTPVPGRVKTRLVPVLGARGAARLHRRMLRATVATAVAAGSGPVELWGGPSVEHPYLVELSRAFGVGLRLQRGADLGMRMHHALSAACAAAPAALLVGSDCPALEPADLRAGARALAEGADAVLGPADDGGYYLVGVRSSDTRVFAGIEWGASGVLDATRARLRMLGWRWCELAVRRDVDRPEDLSAARALLGRCGDPKAPIF